MPKSARADVVMVPGVYEAEFEMSIGSDGKLVSKPVALHYVGDVEFNLTMREVLDKIDNVMSVSGGTGKEKAAAGKETK